MHLVQGVLRWRLRLDWTLRHSSRTPFERIEPPVLNILRLALYQILFMDRVPDSAAVNEAVKQAKAAGPRHVAGFVNGILRNLCRRGQEFPLPERGPDPAGYLSLCHSFPRWLVEKWIRELGMEEAERLMESQNRIPELVIRTNTLRLGPGDLIDRLGRAGIAAAPCAYSPEGLKVGRLDGPVNRLPGFAEGLFQVQGEAAQICSRLLDPAPGESVLDLCAGLGGKSTHLAQLMRNTGRIVSLDNQPARLLGLASAAGRLGAHSIHPVAADASRDLKAVLRGRFDRILVDSPCSGLGIIARHPDIKWSRDESQVQVFARLQGDILDQARGLLRRGGRLLYATCTLSREENEEVVARFLARSQGMRRLDLRREAAPRFAQLLDGQGFFRPLPHVHGMEGFFGALLTKTAQ